MSVALDELLMLPDEDVSAETLARLLAFAQDKDAEVRSLTAESLVRFAPDTDAADALIVLAQDAGALVRTQALDSLAAFPTEKVLACLTAALAREAVDGLPYRYALLAAAEVAAALRQPERVLPFLRTQVDSPVMATRVCAWYGLSLCGEVQAFDALLGALAAEDYHDRCLAVHLLDALGMHKTRVLRALRERLLCETVPAVRTTIEDVLRAEEEKNV